MCFRTYIYISIYFKMYSYLWRTYPYILVYMQFRSTFRQLLHRFALHHFLRLKIRPSRPRPLNFHRHHTYLFQIYVVSACIAACCQSCVAVCWYMFAHYGFPHLKSIWLQTRMHYVLYEYLYLCLYVFVHICVFIYIPLIYMFWEKMIVYT